MRNLSSSLGTKEATLPAGSVSNRKNALLVRQDNTGHDQGSGFLRISVSSMPPC
ncbi:hypothetical protein BDW66DRAFT_104089 [Aspergillus desertorum]